MGRKNLYFLVARNRDTNDFQIVDTTSSYGSSLEEIDLFTMRFENEKDLLTCLQKKGKTTSNDLDFFVAYQKKEKNERRLHFKEVLYSSGERIHDIALASSQGELEDKKREVSYIFYDFCENKIIER